MTEPTERELGHAAGVLEQRLSEYDKHFNAINGSISDTAKELGLMRRAVDELAAAQREATTLAVAVAAALEKKETRAGDTSLTNRGVVAWAAGLIVAAFAIAGGVKAWLGIP